MLNKYVIRDDAEIISQYLSRRSARQHMDEICRIYRGHEDEVIGLRIEIVPATQFPHQRVTVWGVHAGYQFARTQMGRSTFTRTVRHIRRIEEMTIGEITFHGRTLRVRLKYEDQPGWGWTTYH